MSAPCRYVEELDEIDVKQYDCVIVDEAQFLKKAQVQRLVDIVDDMNIPVICYGLRADFQGNLFEGSHWLMAWADTIEEIKTVCWCGRKAIMNARVAGGKVVRSGEQIVLGGNESYVALCRKHWALGELAPMEIRRIASGKEAYMPLLLDADPSREMIGKYLSDGEMYVLLENGVAVSEAVVIRREDGEWEIKNLATAPEYQHTGRGSRLVRHLFKLLKPRCAKLYVGTSPANIPFYERLGFERAYVEKGFFTDNYSEPIIENGKVLTDMIYMVKEL